MRAYGKDPKLKCEGERRDRLWAGTIFERDSPARGWARERGMRIFALIVLIAGVAHGAPLRGAGREAFVRLMEAGHPRWEIPAHAGI